MGGEQKGGFFLSGWDGGGGGVCHVRPWEHSLK